MEREHAASIRWSEAYPRAGLPSHLATVDPAWFADDPPDADGWSLVCRFAVAPAAQGSPSAAHVRFLMPEAPHQRLTPGTRLWLFERGTQRHAMVSIED